MLTVLRSLNGNDSYETAEVSNITHLIVNIACKDDVIWDGLTVFQYSETNI